MADTTTTISPTNQTPPAPLTAAPKKELPPPTKFSLEAGCEQISLKWDKYPGATGYKIYRSLAKDGPFEQPITTTNTSYVDKKLKGGENYYYRLVAVTPEGESKPAKDNLETNKS